MSPEPFSETKFERIQSGLECTVVMLSELEDSFRLDPEFYKKKYVLFERWAMKHPHTFIKNEAAFARKGIFDINAHEYTSEGVPFVRISNLKNMFIDGFNMAYISDNADKLNPKTHLSMGDVVLSKTGEPAASIVNLPECNTSQDIIAIKLKKKASIIAEYLVAFFNTEEGKSALERRFTGNVQMHLNLTECKEKIPIPLFSIEFQNYIKGLINKANKAFVKADEELTLAMNKLDLAIDSVSSIPNVTQQMLPANNVSIKNFSDVCESKRLDAEYYQNKYYVIESYLSSLPTTTINNEFKLIKNNPSKYYAYSGTIGVVKTKQLTHFGIDDSVEDFIKVKDLSVSGLSLLKKKDVVFASMGVGSLGKVGMFTGDGEYTTDSTLKIYRAKDTCRVLPEVLLVYLGSRWAQELIYRYVVGSTGIINIYDTDINKIPVPLLNHDDQIDIANHITNFYSYKNLANKFLKLATYYIDFAISKSEEEANFAIKNQ